MELRSAEEEVNHLQVLYQSLSEGLDHHDDTAKTTFPLLTKVEPVQERPVFGSISNNNEMKATVILETLEQLRASTELLAPRMDRFRKRLSERDSVTDRPRYGEKTASRVTALLEKYQELFDVLQTVYGTKEDQLTSQLVIEKVRELASREEEEERRRMQEEQDQLEREEKERKAEEDRIKQEAIRKEEEARLQREREQAELARQEQEARDAERRAREDAVRADREWTESIRKGADGVREQLAILMEATKGDMAARMTAIGALHTIFSQIVSRPEEPQFRRIRRDHPRFLEEIGRHSGGKEVLIAAGFELGEIDGVPSFISKEPNIEKQMDEWSNWFDLLKATQAVVEEYLMKM